MTQEKQTHATASIQWPLDLKPALEARAAADNRSFSNYGSPRRGDIWRKARKLPVSCRQPEFFQLWISALRRHLAEGEKVAGLEPSAAYKHTLAGWKP
jgi:hypothetical protein